MSEITEPRFLIRLQPAKTEIRSAAGVPLRDLLFEHGVEFPCGGQGRCRGCRVRVLEGEMQLNAAQMERLSPQEIEQGWRLACQCRVTGDLTLELRQWEAAILANDSAFVFAPREGLGVAVDLGTTTLVTQLLDLETGRVLAVRTALNPQARCGADVMSRVQFAVAEHGAGQLAAMVRRTLGAMIRQMLQTVSASPDRLRRVAVVGNTVMHHLFCGIDLEPLSHNPFEPEADGLRVLRPGDLDWILPDNVIVTFLPCLGGFVGSDLLAGILACGMAGSARLEMLVDLGTNGEIVVGNKDRILCASTAAGPAFEGARIGMGMRAATGAIWRVWERDGKLALETLGGGPPQGICGSGLVDAVAAALDLEMIRPTGRLNQLERLALTETVALTQTDIRQLQLAKGAIAAGVSILIDRWGASLKDVGNIHLAGAFGNYIDRASARRIGLLDFPIEKVQPAGNTALLGAKMALFAADDEDYSGILNRVEHVSLNADPDFQEIYVEQMGFPAG